MFWVSFEECIYGNSWDAVRCALLCKNWRLCWVRLWDWWQKVIRGTHGKIHLNQCKRGDNIFGFHVCCSSCLLAFQLVEGQRHMSFFASSVPNVPNFLDKTGFKTTFCSISCSDFYGEKMRERILNSFCLSDRLFVRTCRGAERSKKETRTETKKQPV